MHPALYAANIVDYCRVLALIIAVFVEKASPVLAIALLCVSDGLDGMDGYLARKFNQTSTLGAVLDMATDRAAPAAIGILVAGYSGSGAYRSICAFFTIIDITSHWIRFTLAQRVQTHHKLLPSRFALLRYYYKNRFFLTMECVFYEAFFISTLTSLSCPGLLGRVGAILSKVCLPGAALKTFISLE